MLKSGGKLSFLCKRNKAIELYTIQLTRAFGGRNNKLNNQDKEVLLVYTASAASMRVCHRVVTQIITP